jgi:signal transduction histidine kinase
MEFLPVAPTGPGERAVLLPWFWPDASSFHLLAERAETIPWQAVRSDPGLLLFILARDLPIPEASISEDDLRAAAEMLSDSSAPWTDWKSPALQPAVRAALSAARFAEILAATVDVDPAKAWAGAWLAFAGWLSVGVVDSRAVADCLASPTLPIDPFGAQLRVWGMSRADIAWRLSSEWTMPRWAQVLLGRLDGTPADAEQFGGERRLQAVVQTAVVLAEQAETRLYISEEIDLAAALAELQLRSSDLDRVREQYATENFVDGWLNREWSDPRLEPGLVERLRGEIVLDRDDGDLPLLLDEYTERVKAAKLAAVAEFAAGASHEINNPLAVISGQSQYLLKLQSDDRSREALHSIIRQTRRIHATLTELMYFARPPAPRPEWIELGRLVREAASSLTSLAAERGIEMELGGVTAPLWVDVDPKQLTIALTALIRNGVEAATSGGWVRVSTAFRPDRLEIVVEDSGPGPDELSREHLFDPFYSGRAAGRGRGLGLPAAWRLAREHGGDVRYVPMAGGPTRFVLSLPSSVILSAAQRISA